MDHTTWAPCCPALPQVRKAIGNINSYLWASSLHISIQYNSMQCGVNHLLEILLLVQMQIKTSIQVLTIQRETDKVPIQ